LSLSLNSEVPEALGEDIERSSRGHNHTFNDRPSRVLLAYAL